MSETGPRLVELQLPDFGEPATRPELPVAGYPERIEALRARMARRGYDRLIVFADREHSASMSFLTGFDPRFEEAILIVGPDGDPAILVGNECFGMAGAAPLPLRRHLLQDLSLPGQPRDRSRPLAEILADEGVGRGGRIGVVGWKTYASRATIESKRRCPSGTAAGRSARSRSGGSSAALLTPNAWRRSHRWPRPPRRRS